MVAIRTVVCFAVLAGVAIADVKQCPGKSIDNLNENVQLSCKKTPCRLKKGQDQHITIKFTPETDIGNVKNIVSAEVFGVKLPFVGVDGQSICSKVFLDNGENASCPLKAGTQYTYKDSFPVLSFYPSIDVKVNWVLMDGKNELVCFEVPARIV